MSTPEQQPRPQQQWGNQQPPQNQHRGHQEGAQDQSQPVHLGDGREQPDARQYQTQPRVPQQPQGPYAQQPRPGYGAPVGSPRFTGQSPAPGFYPRPPRQPVMRHSANGFAIAGLIISLIATAVILGKYSQYLSPFGVVGLILSILGYMVNRDDEGVVVSRTARVFAIVGGVLSILAILVTLFTGIFDPSASYGAVFW